MIHVLLTILKILGILLLVILGIILFVVLAVLFVPFRYSVTGEKYKADKQDGLEEQQVLKAKVVVSWLAHLVHFRFRIQNREKDENSEKESKIKTDMELYLFGIPVFALKNKITANRKKSKVKTKTVEQTENSNSEKTNTSGTVENGADETDANADIDATKEKELSVGSGVAAPDESGSENDAGFNAVAEALEEELSQSDSLADIADITDESNAETKTKGNPIKKLFQTIKGIPGKIKAAIEKIKLTIKNICGKIKKGSDFLKKESTKATIHLILGKLKNIIVHVLPKKLKGHLVFGFDDPALTGEVLGAASLFYPKYQKTFKLIPVFEQQILEGKVQIKGRIVIAYLVWQAIKIILDKNARLTFKNAKKLVAELK